MELTTSLTAVEAAALCSKYQALVGKTLVCEYTDFCIIDAIVVSPYDDVNKLKFATHYVKDKDLQNAMAFYKADTFDVLVFGSSISDKETILFESLRDYLKHECIDLTVERIPSYLME
jgi:hypothetical protein